MTLQELVNNCERRCKEYITNGVAYSGAQVREEEAQKAGIDMDSISILDWLKCCERIPAEIRDIGRSGTFDVTKA